MRIILILTLLCTATLLNAQTGVINVQRVLQSQPAFAKTDTLIQYEKLRYQEGYLKLEQPFSQYKKIADSLIQQGNLPAATQQQKTSAETAATNLQKMDAEIQQYLQTAQQKLREYQQIVQQPWYDKVNAAIKAVAMRRKLQTVQEAASMLYIAPGADITDEVIKELKLK